MYLYGTFANSSSIDKLIQEQVRQGIQSNNWVTIDNYWTADHFLVFD